MLVYTHTGSPMHSTLTALISNEWILSTHIVWVSSNLWARVNKLCVTCACVCERGRESREKRFIDRATIKEREKELARTDAIKHQIIFVYTDTLKHRRERELWARTMIVRSFKKHHWSHTTCVRVACVLWWLCARFVFDANAVCSSPSLSYAFSGVSVCECVNEHKHVCLCAHIDVVVIAANQLMRHQL